MDIIIEGKITADEGMSDVIQTVLDLKNPPNPILRISSSATDLNGRVAFSQGGYIVGGRVNNTDEAGYDAIRKLLGVTEGNYAILDPGRAPVQDCNQTLFIKAERLLERLPDLPLTADQLLDVTPEQLAASTVKPVVPAIDLKVSAADGSKASVGSVSSKTRTFDQKTWFFVQLVLWTLGALVVCALILQYGDQISHFLFNMHH